MLLGTFLWREKYQRATQLTYTHQRNPSLMRVRQLRCPLTIQLSYACTRYFKNIDKVTATIKATSFKNKNCKKDFHNAGLLSLLDPIITKWATWLTAALRTFQLFVPLLTIGQVYAS